MLNQIYSKKRLDLESHVSTIYIILRNNYSHNVNAIIQTQIFFHLSTFLSLTKHKWETLKSILSSHFFISPTKQSLTLKWISKVLSKALIPILWAMRVYMLWMKENMSQTKKQLSLFLVTLWWVGLPASESLGSCHPITKDTVLSKSSPTWH